MPQQDPIKAGRLIGGKYRIVRALGGGSMGSVYEATNVWTSRQVAVKVLREDLATIPEIVERFVQEGRSTTMIAHPNVVDVLDMGRDDDGVVYMVQEQLVGVSLDKLLVKHKRLPLRDTLDIAVPIMGGLAAAHRRGIVHRDVKPDNILLAQTHGGRVVAKLIDFGVAKLLDPIRQPRTRPGAVIGTAHYMSPEQVSGSEGVDQRADVWAMGIVLYEMLAGKRPYEGEGVTQICEAITQGPAAPLTDCAPEVPPGVAQVIQGALTQDRSQRHASMELFLEALLSCPALAEISPWLLERHGDALPYQRRHPRYSVHWSCEVACADWAKALELVAANVSQGGIFIASDKPPAVGAVVGVVLRLPNATHLHLRGTILRVVDADAASVGHVAGFAVRFDEEHATDLSVLEQVAAAHQQPGYEALPDAVAVSGPTMAHAPPSAAKQGQPAAHSAPARDKAASARPKIAPRELAGAVGIDFGTTFGSVSVAMGDKVYSIPDPKERTLHPSVVCYSESGQRFVGWEARQRQLTEPARTIPSVKRVLGRSIDEPMLQGYLSNLPCRSIRGPGDMALFEIDGAEIAPVQVAAEIIDHLRRIAEERTGKSVRQAVMSVPLTFGDRQRLALERAASIAGIEVLELIGEPIAAVLAYGFGQQKSETVAVYDFGGGTFDFSVLELTGNSYRVLASGGDSWLGGDDFDMAIAQEAANRFWQATKVDLRTRAVEWQRLLFASERAKRALSSQPQTELMVKRAIEFPQPQDLRWPLQRPHLEQLCIEPFRQSLQVCQSTLESIQLAPQRVDRVVITGGTSRIPFLQRELAKFFGQEVTPLVDPELSVCIGTGLRAAVLTQHGVKQAAHRG